MAFEKPYLTHARVTYMALSEPNFLSISALPGSGRHAKHITKPEMPANPNAGWVLPAESSILAAFWEGQSAYSMHLNGTGIDFMFCGWLACRSND